MTFLDLLVFLFGLAGIFLLIRRFQNLGLSYPKLFWTALAVWHLIFSALASYYVVSHGGDALGYWNLTADTSQQASSWMEYWGYSTFFVQWLNYLPSRVLGLHFFTGTFLYALLSLIGFFFAATWAHPFFERLKSTQPLLSVFFLLTFFLPSPHFWTSLIGKEVLIWLLVFPSLVYAQRARFAFPLVLAFLVAWIRPVVGLLLLVFLLVQLILSDRLSRSWRIACGFLGLMGMASGFYLLLYITHLESISWEQVRQFSEGQYAFLSGFQAGSEIPVQEMQLVEILLAVVFRPFLGELGSVWWIAAGLENLVFFLVSVGLVGLFFRRIPSRNQLVLGLVGLGLAGLYVFSIALSVNVLGVMVRLKTIAMPLMIYFGLSGWSVIFRLFGNLKTSPKPS